MQCLLGELRPLEGDVKVKGKISYASQDAWIFSATLRENVLFGQPFKPVWYDRVIEACALDKVNYTLVSINTCLCTNQLKCDEYHNFCRNA